MSEKTDVKIQINSMKALERLIGGDTELEMEIRKSVALAFSKKYLHDIVATPAMLKITNEVCEYVRIKMAEELGPVKTGYTNRIESMTLSNETKEAIKRQVKKEFDKTVDGFIRAISKDLVEIFKSKAADMIRETIISAQTDLKRQVLEEAKKVMSKMILKENE
jgi:hypothetical protein